MWLEDSKCYFCGREEDIDHLFSHCSVAKMLWTLSSFGMHDIPDNMENIFAVWIGKLDKSDMSLMIVGIYPTFWSLWKLGIRVCLII